MRRFVDRQFHRLPVDVEVKPSIAPVTPGFAAGRLDHDLVVFAGHPLDCHHQIERRVRLVIIQPGERILLILRQR